MNNKKTCYKQNNEKLKEYARNRYHSLDGKTIAKKNYENNIEKLEYVRNRYKNTSKKDKEKLKEFGKIYRKAKKQCYKKVRYFLSRTI